MKTSIKTMKIMKKVLTKIVQKILNLTTKHANVYQNLNAATYVTLH